MPETRASNKLAHPGELLAPKLRRTKGEVEAEHAAKAQAKVDREEAKKQSIIRAAEFEHADRADEDFVNATPHPPFTPKPWPPICNKKKANPIPVAETTDVRCLMMLIMPRSSHPALRSLSVRMTRLLKATTDLLLQKGQRLKQLGEPQRKRE
jgi:hypothetical protein